MADEDYFTSIPEVYLSPADVRLIIDSFPINQLRGLIATAFCRGDQDIVSNVRAIADRDLTMRTIYITSLSTETATDDLFYLFSPYGEVEHAHVDFDGDTGNTMCTGFVTFQHADGAVLALKEPSKKIHGRMTFARRFFDGRGLTSSCSIRMVFVGNVPPDMRWDRLLAHFSSFGEIEEGPLGMDPQTGKFMGFAIFIFKNVDGARNSLLEPIKNIDGHVLRCTSVYSSGWKPGAPLGGVPQPDHRLAGRIGSPAAAGPTHLPNLSFSFPQPLGGVVAYEQGIGPGLDGLVGYPLISHLRGAPYTVMYYPPADSNPGQRVPGGETDQNMPSNT
ncbi:UBP1-associated protein 2C-like [Zingiber officinale]|uniref:RRM domain-containing protein n=1 Tax=Zingiber officinale TaxID=94328 RepID=A0A8J5FQ50_ZINOF|nr:UBP1-associated protein 2C-like [Zingiber officinale]KAG6493106.1 hypothetical protein ZIOFF_048083 [Zingiber officinale]